MTTNKHYIEQAKQAITIVFSNSRVSQEQTLEDLQEIREDLDARINAIREDLGV